MRNSSYYINPEMISFLSHGLWKNNDKKLMYMQPILVLNEMLYVSFAASTLNYIGLRFSFIWNLCQFSQLCSLNTKHRTNFVEATSFDKSQIQALVPFLDLMPKQLQLSYPFILSLMAGLLRSLLFAFCYTVSRNAENVSGLFFSLFIAYQATGLGRRIIYIYG